jgi:hypothetical protein
VPVVGDTKPERDETFYVNLFNATNATIARAKATGTIVNDDGTTFKGSAAGSQIATETFVHLYRYLHQIQGDGAIILSGSGTPDDPYSGTFQFSGSDTHTYVSGPEGGQVPDGTVTIPLTTGPIMANGNTITASVSGIVDFYGGTAYSGTFTGTVSGDTIIGKILLQIPDAGVKDLMMDTTLTRSA